MCSPLKRVRLVIERTPKKKRGKKTPFLQGRRPKGTVGVQENVAPCASLDPLSPLS